MRTRLENIKSLQGIRSNPSFFVKGKDLAVLEQLENAYLLIEDGLIMDFGRMHGELEQVDEVIDCAGSFVLPAWCDSHSHIVFAESRHREFRMRIEGATYQEIAAAGGGILNSAQKLGLKEEDLLYQDAAMRLEEMISYGVGAVEIKSGYGLSFESEVKMLQVIRRLKENYPIPIKATFLGAHAIPKQYKDNRTAYIDEICDTMLPFIAQERLADYCDVFCDEGYFTVEETRRIIDRAASFGMRAKIHANELAVSGGVQVACEMNALSCDHLEEITDEEIRVLKDSMTIPTVLPGTSFFLGINYAPVRKMIDAGLGVCLATDYNPGSTPSGNVPFLLSLACIKMKMTPEEAVNAMTINGACALELEEELGSITRGKKAHLIITEPLDDLSEMMYYYGRNNIRNVVIGHKIY